MIVCLDTNALLQLFGRRSPYQPILRAVVAGLPTLAVSTPMLLEYEEVAPELYGAEFWREAVTFLHFATLAGQVRHITPRFRFRLIAADPDDDAFADCAITADAEFILTEDRHFEVLRQAGYRPAHHARGVCRPRAAPAGWHLTGS